MGEKEREKKLMKENRREKVGWLNKEEQDNVIK